MIIDVDISIRSRASVFCIIWETECDFTAREKEVAPTRRRWAIGVIETDERNRLHDTGYLAPYKLMWKKQGTKVFWAFAACHPCSAYSEGTARI